MKYSQCIILLLMLFCSSCEREKAILNVADDFYDVSGRIVHINSKMAISTVEVRFNDYKTNTDRNGYYKFANLKADTYAVKIRHSDYWDYDKSMLIEKDDVIDFELIPRIEHDIYFRSNRDGGFEIYRMNSNGENLTRITYTEGIAQFKFTADGSYLFYQKATGGMYDIFKADIDGTAEQQLTNISASRIYWDVSHNGERLVYTTLSRNLYVLNIQTTQEDTITETYRGFPVVWSRVYFLWHDEKIVCRATDYAIKVVDLNTLAVRTICDRCVYLDYNWQVFPHEDKALFQDDKITFIVDLGSSWSKRALQLPAGSPKLTLDGAGMIYGPDFYNINSDIILYQFSSQTQQSLKTISRDQFDASVSSFSFSADGNLIIWNSGPVMEDIFRMDIHGCNLQQLTSTPATDRDPVFRPAIN